jgi:hypothetical protein
MAKKLPWFIFITFVSIKLLWNGFGEPLTEVHWDSVDHLYYAKQFADTPFIRYYSQQAAAIASQVDGHWPHGEQFSSPYWRFSRLGHIALLGMVVQMFGAREEAIIAAHWLYHTLMALTMVCAVILVITIIKHTGINCSPQVRFWAAAGSAVLYMTSDIYDYMGRCLVSEVPAIFLLTIACLLFITGLNCRSMFFACLSGFCAFLVYSVRLESVWVYIAFCVVLATTLWSKGSSAPWWRTYVGAGGSALAWYLLYSWYFFPLANPYLFILFAKYQPVWGGEWTVPIYIHMSVAGGLLWIGGFASLIAMTRWTAARMAFAWVSMTLLPTLPYLIYNSVYTVPLQVRMLTVLLVVPLLFTSTLGWVSLWDEQHRGLRYGVFAVTLSTVCLLVIALSLAVNQVPWLDKLMRKTRISAFLQVPHYERNTYRFNEMNHISQVLYSKETPLFLVYEKDDIRGEDLALIRFFGPAYPPQANLTMMPAHYAIQCGESIPAFPSLEKVSPCVGMTADTLQRVTDQGMIVFLLTSLLRKNDIIMPFSYTEVLRTQHYRLGIIAP